MGCLVGKQGQRQYGQICIIQKIKQLTHKHMNIYIRYHMLNQDKKIIFLVQIYVHYLKKVVEPV